jgi:hypothetical protein
MAQSDIVVGVFRREDLSTGLVGTHRAGFGPHARVLDSARGQLAAQLRKAGYGIPVSFAAGDTDTVLILISAPGRATLAAETLNRAGAQAVHLAMRPDHRVAATPEAMPREPAAVVAPEAPPADAR